MMMQAYLGASKPEALAEGQGNPGHQFAVVRQDAETGECSWVGTYESEAVAVASVDRQTTHRGFGILCSVRVAPKATEAAAK